MKKKSKVNAVGAWTDNAANLKKAFFDINEEEDESILLNMSRISCACHTIQLALKDLITKDKLYRYLI